MKSRLPVFTLALVVVASRGLAADEEPTRTNMKAALTAQLEEDAKKQNHAAYPSPVPARPGTAGPASSSPAPSTSAGPAKGAVAQSPLPTPPAKDAAKAKAKEGPVTMMPKVEVRKQRITELDQQVHAKDKEIEDETKKTKATETDETLNSSKISGGVMSIFGGRSAEVGESLAKQRVMLLEIERDLVEQIALAKTKEEKADLQKQLEDMKAMRRDLDKAR